MGQNRNVHSASAFGVFQDELNNRGGIIGALRIVADAWPGNERDSAAPFAELVNTKNRHLFADERDRNDWMRGNRGTRNRTRSAGELSILDLTLALSWAGFSTS